MGKKHSVKQFEIDDKTHQENRAKLKAASVSVIANTSLIIVKLIVAIVSGSIAILAEVLHSGFDLLASIFAYLGIRQASKPANRNYHYGHEKFENLSSLLQTLLIIITAIVVIYEAITRLITPHQVDHIAVSLGIMILTLIVDILVSRYLHRVSKESGSAALEADAYHFTTDLWSAIAVIVGLLITMFGFPIFDSVAAIVVAILMLWVSYHLGKKSLSVMLDHSPDKKIINTINETIQAHPDVINHHKLRVRQSGSKMFADVHIHVLPDMTVYTSHKVAHELKQQLMRLHPQLKDVTIHIEPASFTRRALNKVKKQ